MGTFSTSLWTQNGYLDTIDKKWGKEKRIPCKILIFHNMVTSSPKENKSFNSYYFPHTIQNMDLTKIAP